MLNGALPYLSPSTSARPATKVKTRQQDDASDSFSSGGSEDGEDMEDEYEELEIDPEDHETLAALQKGEGAGIGGMSLMSLSAQNVERDEDDLDEAEGQPRTLADIIFAKMGEANAGTGPKLTTQPERGDDGPLDPRVGLNPKVVEVYTK